MLALVGKAKQGAALTIFDEVDIEPEVFEKASQAYQKERLEDIKVAMGVLEKTERLKFRDADYTIMSREDTLKNIDFLED